MLPLDLMTAPQLADAVAARARRRRLDRNWTQQELAERAGMSLSSLRRFERTGQIAFASLVRVAIALDAVEGVAALFPNPPETIDDLLSPSTRQRGRRS